MKVFLRMQLSRIVAIFLIRFAVNAYEVVVKNNGEDFDLVFTVEWNLQGEMPNDEDPNLPCPCTPLSFQYVREGQRSCWIEKYQTQTILVSDNGTQIKIKVWLRRPNSMGTIKVFDHFYSDKTKCLEFKGNSVNPKWDIC